MEAKINETTITLVKGDITLEATDAIVNAANSALAGGGGVDGAIHKAGGPEIMKECRAIGGCPTGSAVITGGGKLKAKFVIHTVGPIYKDGKHKEKELLASAYRASLSVAHEKGLKSVAFPSISTGAYGYPIKEAAVVAIETIVAFAKTHKDIKNIRFVLFSDAALKTYSDALHSVLGS